MAFSVDLTPSSGGQLLKSFCTLVVGAGGTAIDHYNGTSVIAGAPAGNTTLNGANRWMRLRLPQVTHEIVFQVYDASLTNYLRIKISPGGFANDGSTTAIPSAADGFHIYGSGADDNPAYSPATPTNGTYVGHLYVSSSAQAPGFWFKAYDIGGGETNYSWMMDPVIPWLSSDTDPFVYWVSDNTAQYRNSNHYGHPNNGPLTYFGKGTGSEALVRIAACQLNNGGQSRVNGNTNPVTGYMDSYPVIYASSYGIKGISKLHELNFKLNIVNGTGATVGGLANVKATFGDIICNWTGVDPPGLGV